MFFLDQINSSRDVVPLDSVFVKKISWFDRQGFGRGGEISSFLGELGLLFCTGKNLECFLIFRLSRASPTAVPRRPGGDLAAFPIEIRQ